jgi:hypothetical protein
LLRRAAKHRQPASSTPTFVGLFRAPQTNLIWCRSYLLPTCPTIANDDVGIVRRGAANESLPLRSRCALALHGQ